MHDEPPVSPSDSEETSPAPKARLRWLWRTLLGVALALLLALGAVAGLLASARDSAGLTRLVQVIEWGSGGRLTVAAAEGDLFSRWQLHDIRFESATTQLGLSRLELAWQPSALWQQHAVRVDLLALGDLRVVSQPDPVPSTAPDSLTLPLALDIRQLSLASLALDARGEPVLSHVQARVSSDGRRTHLTLSHASTPWAGLEGDATLDGVRPFGISALVVAKGRLAGERPEPAEIRLALSGSLLDLHLGGGLAFAGASGALVATLSPFEPLAYRRLRQAQLQLARLDLSRLGAGLPRTDIRLDLDLATQGDGSRLAGNGRLQLVNALAGIWPNDRLPLEQATARVDIDGARWQVSDSEIRALGGTIGVAGELQGERLGLTATLAGVDLAQLVPVLPTRIGGRIGLDGQLPEPVMELALDDRGRTLTGRLALKGAAAARQLQLAQLRFVDGPARVTAEGDLALHGEQRFALAGQVARLDLARYLPAAPVSDIQADWQAKGQLAPLDATLDWQFGPSRLAGEPLSGHARIAAAADGIRKMDVQLAVAGNRVQASGAWGKPGQTLAFVLDAPRLAALGGGFAGTVSGQGSLSGSLQSPVVDARLRAAGLALPFAVRIDRAELDARLPAAATAPLAIRLDASGVRLPDVELKRTTLSLDGSRARHRMQLVLDGSLAGQVLSLQLAAQGGVQEAPWGWSGRIDTLENRGRWPVRLLAPVELDAGAGRVGVRGLQMEALAARISVPVLDWRPGALVSRGQVDNVVLADWLAKFPQADLPVQSNLQLSADWDVRATDRLAGRFAVRRQAGDLSVTQRDLPRPVALKLTAMSLEGSLEGDRVLSTLSLQSATFGAATLSSTSRVPRVGGDWRWAEAVWQQLRAQADMPSLAWASVYAGPTASLAGRLEMDVSVSGPAGQRSFAGYLRGRGLAYQDADLGVSAKEGEFDIQLQKQRLLLTSLRFAGGRGSLSGSGWLGLESDEPTGLVSLDLRDFQALNRPDRNLTVNGQLQATLEAKGVVVDGRVDVLRGRIDIPKGDRPRLGDDVVVAGMPRPAAREGRTKPFWLNVTVGLGDNLKLMGHGIDALLKGALRITASPTQPLSATGQVDVVDGRYRAYGQDLTIEHGVVTFQGPIDNPGLDILAVRTGLPVEAGVQVSGTVNRLQVKLVSTPNVPDNEKLSWLILGRAGLSGGAEDAGLLLTAASVLLSDADAVPLQQQIANTFGLDEIGLSTRTSALDDGTGSSDLTTQVLTLGKRLSERLYLSYEQGIEDASQIVKLTYQLSRRWSVVARAGTDNAVDLFYTLYFDTPAPPPERNPARR